MKDAQPRRSSYEIERKFLVGDTSFLAGLQGAPIVQCYVSRTDRSTLRVRISGTQAWLTLKGRSSGIRRREFEYPIPLDEAETILAELCEGAAIRKTRYAVLYREHIWDVDVFHEDNSGLVLAEIELGHEDEVFARPGWLAQEVTADFRYANSSLSTHPFCRWQNGHSLQVPDGVQGS